MADMTGSDPTRSTWPEEEPAPAPEQEPDTSQSAEDPGYLTETGQAVGEDGSVVPIIAGGPPARGSHRNRPGGRRGRLRRSDHRRSARRRGFGLGYRRPGRRARRGLG